MRSISPLAKAVTRAPHPMEPLTSDNDSDGSESARSRHLKFGMWLFLSTETLIFGAFFVIYLWNRLHQNAGFTVGSQHMDFWMGGVNTLVLLTSSYFMALAVNVEKRLPKLLALIPVLGLGTLFLVIKAFEYKHHYEEGLFPGFNFTFTADLTAQVYAFFSLYLLGTGLHAIHMIIGLGLVSFTGVQTFRRKDTKDLTELVGLYWHFVDIVWVFLFPAFYLIGTRG